MCSWRHLHFSLHLSFYRRFLASSTLRSLSSAEVHQKTGGTRQANAGPPRIACRGLHRIQHSCTLYLQTQSTAQRHPEPQVEPLQLAKMNGLQLLSKNLLRRHYGQRPKNNGMRS